MAFAHEETDQTLVRSVHDLSSSSEADSRGIYNRKVIGHRAVKAHESVVKHRQVIARDLADFGQSNHGL
jgi:hypothetical protein